ncbi:riboflavin synthase [Myxococcota bacterium]|nr:riboflavin synthase [Myxococcota bacterium]
MFGGIVEEFGFIRHIEPQNTGIRLTIDAARALDGTQIGDSIAVNGVCLTVIFLTPSTFCVDVVPESLKRSNLSTLRVGSPVNLERALRPDRPVGGHYVQGHVDTTIEVIDKTPEGDAQNYTFRAPLEVMRYIVPKGYVAVDGASLTVVHTQHDSFSVTLIPHTQSATVIGSQGVGYYANLEVDITGKYLERAVGDRIAHLEARVQHLESHLAALLNKPSSTARP